MAEPRYRHLASLVEQGVLVLTLTEPKVQGEELTEQIGQELHAAVEDAGIIKVVIDFARVSFLTSLGIQALIAFRRYLRPAGGQLLLCNLSPTVADVLFTAHVASTSESAVIPFRVAPDVATAVGQLMQPAADS
jgi:anti-anti-sigma factor